MFGRLLKTLKIPASSPDILGGVTYTLYSNDGTFMVKAVNICDWLDHTYGDDWSKHPDYETRIKDLTAWCDKNDVHYYSRDRDGFFMSEAVEEAIAGNKTAVVVEDLS